MSSDHQTAVPHGSHTDAFFFLKTTFEQKGVGFFVARKNLLTSEGSKVMASLLVWVLYPCLLFANIVAGIDSSNIGVFGVMTIAAVVNAILGLTIGNIVLRLTNPPKDFRYGAVLATAMGNNGDLPFAIVASIGTLAPFTAADATTGAAYIAAFMCFTNIFFFSVGYIYFGEDFKQPGSNEPTLPSTSEAVPESPVETAVVAPSAPRPVHPEDQLSFSASTAVVSREHAAEREDGWMRSIDSTSSTVAGPAKRTAANCKLDTVAEIVGKAPELRVEDDLHQLEPAERGGADVEAGVARKPRRWPRRWVLSARAKFVLQSTANLANIGTISGLIITATPLKQLFVASSTSSHEPPLSFLFQSIQYLSQSAVPLALLNLGAALGRLNVSTLGKPSVIAGVAIARLLVLPAIAITTVWGLVRAGVLGKGDKMMLLVMMLEGSVPTAASTVFFTQLWHPRGEATAIAGVVIVQYVLAMFTMTVCLSVIISIAPAAREHAASDRLFCINGVPQNTLHFSTLITTTTTCFP
ncbi:auxin efflux carrier [Zopfochytrium polystomum]|nr:auxin efflux carrier [Zopfochytrium polystomum]